MMKDNYAKVILTIIAVCLLWICVRDLATPVSAQRATQRVIIAGYENFLGGLPVQVISNKPDLPTRVVITGVERLDTTLPVTIKAVDMEGPGWPREYRYSLPIHGQVTVANTKP